METFFLSCHQFAQNSFEALAITMLHFDVKTGAFYYTSTRTPVPTIYGLDQYKGVDSPFVSRYERVITIQSSGSDNAS